MKIAVLLSGGVDSSVALRLLQDQGHEVHAFYLKVWLEDSSSAYLAGQCPWEEDLRFARAICDQLSVPLEVISCQKAYWDRVVSYALSELRAGGTPSPDIFCNQRIKFGAFFERIPASFDLVASGHYARLEQGRGERLLKRAVDPVKDQTYFLSHLSQTQLRRACFPIGDLPKERVRALAREMALPSQSRPDSQGICFLGKINYRDFVREHLGERAGPIVDESDGRELGQHRGYWFHTIGQRQGLGLSGGPWYVSGKDVERNTVFVVHGDRLQQRLVDRFRVEALHWCGSASDKRALQVKLRHGPTLIPAEIDWRADGAEVQLESPDPGIAPGQFTVFYDGETCLGGAKIV